jgi:hypothetical protein
VVKGEGKARGKVVGTVKVKPNGLPDYPVITGNWINYLLWADLVFETCIVPNK